MPRSPQYSSNAERQKAYRLRQAKAAAERLAEHAALRRVVGADEDDIMADATAALTQAHRTADPGHSDEAIAAAFAVGYQEGHAAGYEEGYAAAASARLAELLKAPRPDGDTAAGA
jgi:hypothetical protein